MATSRKPIPLRRFLFLGPTGAGKSKMINCCYNRSVEPDALRNPPTVAEPVSCIGTTSSLSNYVDQRNRIVYVDTIGYGDITEDTFVYFQTIQQLLGEKSLARCTIVFTHCPEKDMTLDKFFEANKQHAAFINIIRSVKSVIFGDMETENKHSNTQGAPKEIIHWLESQLFEQRHQFMKQMLKQIDEVGEEVLELDQDWGKFYWTKFKSFLGYCWEKIFRQSNELSRLYKSTIEMKKGILLMIYYQECSICLELITEIVNHSPKACITKCGHVFHYQCLKRAFEEKKECPNCRTNLQNLPERISAAIAGFKQIIDPLKANVNGTILCVIPWEFHIGNCTSVGKRLFLFCVFF